MWNKCKKKMELLVMNDIKEKVCSIYFYGVKFQVSVGNSKKLFFRED
jgi:hypothetical protein